MPGVCWVWVGAGSVNIGVLLSEKLLPTVGLRLVFTESSESTKEEGDTHRHTHARQKKKKYTSIFKHRPTYAQSTYKSKSVCRCKCRWGGTVRRGLEGGVKRAKLFTM